MFQDIVAVSLNPALDISLWVDRLAEGETAAVFREERYAGGKAANVARTLAALSVPCRLLSLVGAENASSFQELLAGERLLACLPLEVPGRIRENLSLVLPDGRLYKLDRDGFSVSPGQLEHFCGRLLEELRASKHPLAVFAGSLPQGVQTAQYIELMEGARREGARLAVDTAFLTEAELRSLHPFLIKPNQQELAALAGRTFSGIEETARYLKALSEDVEVVLASLGKDGLLGARAGKCCHAAVPSVLVKSTVSAGDATLAGFLAAWKQGGGFAESLRFAAGCGAASVQLDGSAAVRPDAAGETAKEVVLRWI